LCPGFGLQNFLLLCRPVRRPFRKSRAYGRDLTDIKQDAHPFESTLTQPESLILSDYEDIRLLTA
jgi:hypothetical protein